MNHNEPELRLIIRVQDQSLELAALEPLATDISVRYATPVDIQWSWGGPAAGGPGWGAPEIAVVITGGELLRRFAGDGYELLKNWCAENFHRIKTRNAARWYIAAALGVEMVSPVSERRFIMCIPEGTSSDGLVQAWNAFYDHAAELDAQFGSNDIGDTAYIRWVAESAQWERLDRPAPTFPQS